MLEIFNERLEHTESLGLKTFALFEFGLMAQREQWTTPEEMPGRNFQAIQVFPNGNKIPMDTLNEFPMLRLSKWQKELLNSRPTNEPQFDSDHENYPTELDIAFQAWRAVAVNNQGGTGTPKGRIKAWLEENYSDINNATKERIATVCNWDKTGGRPTSE